MIKNKIDMNAGQWGLGFLSVFLVVLVAACGGGGSKSHLKFGEKDAQSSRNAVNSTRDSSQGAASSGRTSSTGYSRAQASIAGPDESDDDSSDLPQSSPPSRAPVSNSRGASKNEWKGSGDEKSGKGSKKCDIQGSATMSYVIQNNTALVTLTGEDCLDEKEGGFSGTLTLEIPSDFSQIKLNGKVDGIGLNAKGEYAKHELTFKNLSFPLNFNFNGGDFAQLNCSGSLVIDGTEKDCQSAFKDSSVDSSHDADQVHDNKSPDFNGSSQRGTFSNLYIDASQGLRGVFAVEIMGARIIRFKNVVAITSSESRIQIPGQIEAFRVDEWPLNKGIQLKIAGDLNLPPTWFDGYSSQGRALQFSSSSYLPLSAFEVVAVLDNGREVTVHSKN